MTPVEILQLQVSELERRLAKSEAREQSALDIAKDLRSERDAAQERAIQLGSAMNCIPDPLPMDCEPRVQIVVIMRGRRGKAMGMVEVREADLRVTLAMPGVLLVHAAESAARSCARGFIL